MLLFNRTFFFGAVVALSLLGGGVVFAGVDLGNGYSLDVTSKTNDTGWVSGPGVNNGGTTNSTGVAQGLNFVPLVKDYPQLGRMQNPDIPSFLNTLFAITIAAAATLAVVMVAIGGIEYMMTESPFKMGDAKDRIQSAIFGLLIVLTSVLLLKTINPQIVSLNLFSPSKPATTQQPQNVSPQGTICPPGQSVDANTGLCGEAMSVATENAQCVSECAARNRQTLSADSTYTSCTQGCDTRKNECQQSIWGISCTARYNGCVFQCPRPAATENCDAICKVK